MIGLVSLLFAFLFFLGLYAGGGGKYPSGSSSMQDTSRQPSGRPRSGKSSGTGSMSCLRNGTGDRGVPGTGRSWI